MMGTFLFKDVVFGPVNSRRLGASLGINLLPPGQKICTFNCIYCECGWTKSAIPLGTEFPARNLVKEALEERLKELSSTEESPDAITFAGNGEPTLHPLFEEIMDDTLRLRDKYSPGIDIVVLSNGSTAGKENVYRALKRADQNVLKLDTGFEDTFHLLNQPSAGITISQIINNMKRFNGTMIIQTLFIRGNYRGKHIDNTSDHELKELFRLYWILRPREIMVYTYSRGTPISSLEKISHQELEQIAHKIEGLGISTRVSS